MPGWVADLAARVGALLTKGGLWMGIGVSAGLAVGSIVLVVIVVINWRADHFKHWPPGTAPPLVPEHPLATIAEIVDAAGMAVAPVDRDRVLAHQVDRLRAHVVGHGRRFEDWTAGGLLDAEGAPATETQIAGPVLGFVPVGPLDRDRRSQEAD